MWEWHNRNIGISRPFAVIGLSALVAAAVYLILDLSAALILGTIILAVSLIALLLRRINITLNGVLALISAAISVFSVAILQKGIYEPLWKYDGSQHSICGKVVSIPQYGDEYTYYILKVNQIDGRALEYQFNVRFTCETLLSADIYDYISAEVKLFKPESIDGTGFDAENYYLSDKIALSAVESRIFLPFEDNEPTLSVVGNESERDFNYYILKLRQKVTELCREGLSDNAAGMLCGIMLGDKSLISDEVKDNFAFAGVSHLLAVSGLHLTFILSVFFWLAEKFSIHRRFVNGIGILFILLFMAIAGFSGSVMRAGIMCILTLFAEIILKEADPLNSLGASIIFILIINPFSAVDVGLLLSVFATFGIVTLHPKLNAVILKLTRLNLIKGENKLKRSFVSALKKVIAVLSLTVCVTAATLPIITLTYGYISLVSVASNLLIVPIAEVILILGVLKLIFKLIMPVKAVTFTLSFLIERLVSIVEFLAEALTSSKYCIFPISGETLLYFFVTVIIIGLLIKLIKSFGIKCVSASAVAVAFMTVTLISHCADISRLKIYVWGTESASCVMLTKNGNSFMLCYDGSFAYSVATGIIRDDTAFSLGGVYNISQDDDDTKDLARITDRYLTVNGEGDLSFDGDVYIKFTETENAKSAIVEYNGFSALFTFNADQALSPQIKGNYSLIYADMNKRSVTNYIVNEKAAELVIFNDRYNDNPYFVKKCNNLGYDIINIDNCAANLICVDKTGEFIIEEWS